MNIFRNILFVKVVAIILLHSFIPHKHHAEMTYQEHKVIHENADDIIDYLGLTFHHDPNYSLKNYTPIGQSHPKDLNFNGFNFLANACFAKGEFINKDKNQYQATRFENTFNGFIVLENGLRAPPRYGFTWTV